MNRKRILSFALVLLMVFAAILPAVSSAEELTGEAYAVFDSTSKSLVFFRSAETYADKTEYTNIPVGTNTYSGIVYNNIETRPMVSRPWNNVASEVKRVIVADPIKPSGNMSISYWFQNFSACESFDVAKLDTSAAPAMGWVFDGCSSVTELDLSTWDFSKVGTIQYMFQKCKKLKTITFPTGKTFALNGWGLFHAFDGCYSLENLDISCFDTTNVTGGSNRDFYPLPSYGTVVTNMKSVTVGEKFKPMGESGFPFGVYTEDGQGNRTEYLQREASYQGKSTALPTGANTYYPIYRTVTLKDGDETLAEYQVLTCQTFDNSDCRNFTPTKEGLVFVNWYKDAELTQEMTSTDKIIGYFVDDVVLYAKFSEPSVADLVKTAEQGAEISVPEATVLGDSDAASTITVPANSTLNVTDVVSSGNRTVKVVTYGENTAYIVSNGTNTAAIPSTAIRFADESKIDNESETTVAALINMPQVLASALTTSSNIKYANTLELSLVISDAQSSLPAAIEAEDAAFAFEVHPEITVTLNGSNPMTYDASNEVTGLFTFTLDGLEPQKTYAIDHYGKDGTLKKHLGNKVASADGTISVTLDSFSYLVGTLSESNPVGGYLKTFDAYIYEGLYWNVYFVLDESISFQNPQIVVQSGDVRTAGTYTLTYDNAVQAYKITVPIRHRLINQPTGFTLIDGDTTYALRLTATGTTEYLSLPYTFNDYLTGLYGVLSDEALKHVIDVLWMYRDALLAKWAV